VASQEEKHVHRLPVEGTRIPSQTPPVWNIHPVPTGMHTLTALPTLIYPLAARVKKTFRYPG